MQRSAMLLCALCAHLPAQNAPRPELVAWSEAIGPALSNGVQLQTLDTTCPPARLVCRSILGNPLFYAGGTAYDVRRQTVWYTTGTTMLEVALRDCSVSCQFTPQLMNSAAVVSGLAMLDGGRRLLQLETTPGYLGMRSYDTSVCPPTPLRDGCTLPLAAGAVAGGLATDAENGLVFVAVSTPNAIDWTSEILVMAERDRCTPLCRFPVPRCGPFYPRSGAVTGLGYDACAQTLYVTNGQHSQGLLVRNALRCDFTAGWCCPVGSSWGMKGLDVVPGWQQSDVGASCVPSVCPPCAMRGELAGGDAVPGNSEFAVRLVSAQGGSIAILVLNANACTAGTQFPFLCGPVYPALLPAPYVSPQLRVVSTGGTCDGVANHPLPLPQNRSLCGLTLCTQWLVLCVGTAPGFGVTQAISFKIAG